VKQCLIVDDSRVVRKIARRILEGFKLSIEEASNGMEALECVRRAMPDAILLDWASPHSGASEFLRTLRREPNGAKPVVIFAAIENDAAQISEAIKSGANDYVMKPFDRETLQTAFTDTGLIN
jgi:two-component system chemotaxis response regulator CheY